MPVIVYPEAIITFPKMEDLFKRVIWMDKTRNPRLLLDLDGVVVRYDFVRLVKRYFGVDIESEAIYAYNLADVLGVSTKEIDNMFQEQVWGTPIFMENALDVLKEIKQTYEILIYSNRIKYMGRTELIRWLVNYLIPFDDIDYGKGTYDFHIDDRPEKLENTNSSIRLLYSQPWNKQCLNIKNNLKRVSNWLDIRKEVLYNEVMRCPICGVFYNKILPGQKCPRCKGE